MKKGINILSLFDGMSCGQIALERAGIKVDNYYASEIEETGIKVTQFNYPDTVQLGDATKWREWNIDWSSIDMVIGGSPCQGFSFIGKQLNFNDIRSKLFFEYVDIMNHIKTFNPDVKFLLENVKMKKEYQDVISGYVKVQPININSALVSAQNRERLYWTNIPNVSQPKDKLITLQDVLMENIEDKFYLKNRTGSILYPLKKYNEFYQKYGYTPKMFNPYNCNEITDKSPTLTAVGSRVGNSSTVLIKEINGDIRQLTPTEWERLQTVPENYTSGISDTHRFNVLGNGWTVDVIAHIFSYLPEEYKI